MGGEASIDTLRFEAVTLRRSSGGRATTILDRVDWVVRPGEHWGVIGPNGAGKTSLLRLASAQIRPTSGSATVLGGTLGRVPMYELRRRIGLVEPAFGRRFYADQRVLDVVLSGIAGTILLVDEVTPDDHERALDLLDAVGARQLTERPFLGCSEGERARILLARALIANAELLAMDEPAAALDLPGREFLLSVFGRVTAERPGLASITITHHIEELPPAISHLLFLRAGAVVASGPLDQVLTDETLTDCFGMSLRVERIAGRIFALSGI